MLQDVMSNDVQLWIYECLQHSFNKSGCSLSRYFNRIKLLDPRHPAENLLKGDSSKKWLSAPGDKSGQLEAIFQLDHSCVITHIDIGTFWAFSVSVLVGRSSQSSEFKTLVPSAAFMTPVEVKLGKNKVGMRMFSSENLTAGVREESWDRVKVVCSQPYKKNIQFGLSVLKVVSAQIQQPVAISPLQSLVSNKSPKTMSLLPKVAEIRSSNQGNRFSSPSWKSASEIHKHFFGKNSKENHSEDNNKSAADLSRTSKLVKAAVDKTPKYKVIHDNQVKGQGSKQGQTLSCDRAVEQGPRKKKVVLSFDEEVRIFLNKLNIKKLMKDNENLQFSELRHQLEREKRRKLSKIEKKVFFDLALTMVEENVSDSDGEDGRGRPSCQPDDSVQMDDERDLNLHLSVPDSTPIITQTSQHNSHQTHTKGTERKYIDKINEAVSSDKSSYNANNSILQCSSPNSSATAKLQNSDGNTSSNKKNADLKEITGVDHPDSRSMPLKSVSINGDSPEIMAENGKNMDLTKLPLNKNKHISISSDSSDFSFDDTSDLSLHLSLSSPEAPPMLRQECLSQGSDTSDVSTSPSVLKVSQVYTGEHIDQHLTTTPQHNTRGGQRLDSVNITPQSGAKHVYGGSGMPNSGYITEKLPCTPKLNLKHCESLVTTPKSSKIDVQTSKFSSTDVKSTTLSSAKINSGINRTSWKSPDHCYAKNLQPNSTPVGGMSNQQVPNMTPVGNMSKHLGNNVHVYSPMVMDDGQPPVGLSSTPKSSHKAGKGPVCLSYSPIGDSQSRRSQQTVVRSQNISQPGSRSGVVQPGSLGGVKRSAPSTSDSDSDIHGSFSDILSVPRQRTRKTKKKSLPASVTTKTPSNNLPGGVTLETKPTTSCGTEVVKISGVVSAISPADLNNIRNITTVKRLQRLDGNNISDGPKSPQIVTLNGHRNAQVSQLNKSSISGSSVEPISQVVVVRGIPSQQQINTSLITGFSAQITKQSNQIQNQSPSTKNSSFCELNTTLNRNQTVTPNRGAGFNVESINIPSPVTTRGRGGKRGRGRSKVTTPAPSDPRTDGQWLNTRRQSTDDPPSEQTSQSARGRGRGRGRRGRTTTATPSRVETAELINSPPSRMDMSSSPPSTVDLVSCPMCNGGFSVLTIEAHASTCSLPFVGDISDSDDSELEYLPTSTPSGGVMNNSTFHGGPMNNSASDGVSGNYMNYEDLGNVSIGASRLSQSIVGNSQTASQLARPDIDDCPICGRSFLRAELIMHADRCAQAMF